MSIEEDFTNYTVHTSGDFSVKSSASRKLKKTLHRDCESSYVFRHIATEVVEDSDDGLHEPVVASK